MAISVRAARPEDDRLIVPMVEALSAFEGAPKSRFTSERYRRDGFGPDAAFSALIAEWDGFIAGYCLFHPAYNANLGVRGSYLAHLFVREEARRRGAGRALMAAVAEHTLAAGGAFVTWSMVSSNRAAGAFYRSLGAQAIQPVAWSLTRERLEAML